MGPRSRDRGIAVKAQVAIKAVMLQWGRGHVTAESEFRDGVPLPLTLLQWGRGHVTAESRPEWRYRYAQLPASMGPRSRDRGILAPINERVLAKRASMGPRSRDRGIRKSAAGLGLRIRASMGPRSRDRGILAQTSQTVH